MITKPDPILAVLPADALAFIEDQLANNENDTDDELHAHFIANGLTSAQAERALSYRDLYLKYIYLRGATPIRGMRTRYDPRAGVAVED